jgi:hypothetical protein
MVTAIIIPIVVVAIIGIAGYVLYRFVIYDLICNKNVNEKLRKYNIKKTQSEIIKEYHQSKGENISEKEVSNLEKHYRQHEPEQFLAMYDAVRKKSNSDNSS